MSIQSDTIYRSEEEDNNNNEQREEYTDSADQQNAKHPGEKASVRSASEDDVKPSAADSKSPTDEEFNDLFDAVQEKTMKECDHEQSPEEHEDIETDEELQDADNMQDLQHHNIHSDLVTPELSAEDQIPVNPPKLSQKKPYKKRSPKADRNKNRSRKLEYRNPVQLVPLHKAIKRKLLPKSDTKLKKQHISKKKQLQERKIQQDGTWVQCMHSECLKWRYLRDITDPSLIPEYWVCEKNSDPEYNSCDKPEEDWHYLDFVYTKFTEGSIVLAKMQGYPWWPAMVEIDPDTGTYCEQQDTETYPSQYHVVFLDKNVSRTWLKSSSIKKYETEDSVQTKAKGKDFKHLLSQAFSRANKALSMSVQERIRTFGFSHTFKGKIVDSSQYLEESDHDQSDNETKDEDVGLDLEMLGVDVDEILEQAEALLSEAGRQYSPCK